MELTEAVVARHMVRAFTNDPIPRPVLSSLLELARRAPSAGNTQATEFLILSTPKSVSQYWQVTMTEAKRQRFRWQSLLTAPALILVLTKPSSYANRYSEPDKKHTGLGQSCESWPVPYWWVDSGAVIQNLLLAVTNIGLGACLFGLFDHESAVKEQFSIPKDRRIAGAIALGYPAQDEPGRSAKRPRPHLDNIAHWGTWTSAT